MKNRLLAALLCACMIFGCMGNMTVAFAAEEDVIAGITDKVEKIVGKDMDKVDSISGTVTDIAGKVEKEEELTEEDKEALIAAAQDLAYLVSEYYDEAYAEGYKYADENGYVDIAVDAIDTAIEAVKYAETVFEGLEAGGEKQMTEAFKAELLPAFDEAVETLEAAQVLLKEADVLDQDTLNELLATLEEAGETLAIVLKALIQAGHDLEEPVIIPALEEAYRILTEEVVPAVEQMVKEALTAAAEWLEEKLEEAYEAFLAALPEIDEALYNWLYNNPETVIAFFEEYGEYFVEYAEEILAVLGYVAAQYGDDVVEYVLNNPEEALKKFVEWYDTYGYRVWPMVDVYLEELGFYDMIEAEAAATIEKIEKALEELGVEIQKQIQDKIDEIKAMIEGEIKATIEEIEKAIDELIAMIEEMLYDATHGEYTVTAGSYYVAIDELYAEGEGYADKLAAELGIAYTEINELDEAEIAKADLITVRYNNEPMIAAMIEDAKDYKKVEPKDWSVYVGEEGCEYVQQALAEVEAMLAEQGMDELSEMAVVAVASYAYEYVAHLIEYVQVLETIAEINPDALVISVGMNNALADVVLTMGEDEIALGEYVQYVVDAANLEAFAYVLVTGNAIYVDAPAVETEFDAEEAADVMDFILNLIDEESREVLLATDAGHEYIKEQILNALTITYEGLLGDANNDGVVDYVDAIYVLEYDAKLRAADELALHLCDVNGDGAVDYVDAIFILEYDAQLITKFPAAA